MSMDDMSESGAWYISREVAVSKERERIVRSYALV